MITLGIDLSSMPEGTAACCIEWRLGRAVVSPPLVGCTDEQLDQFVRKAEAVGIDAPLGWPTEFVAAVRQWTFPVWNEDIRDRLRFRETDRWLRQCFGLSPLSVSSDLIALPAMRAMALLQRHGVTDRSGDGRFFEVYPAGSLAGGTFLRRATRIANKEPRCAGTCWQPCGPKCRGWRCLNPQRQRPTGWIRWSLR